MERDYKYLFWYLAIVFILSWGIIICCTAFADVLTPIIGRLTLTHPLVIFVLYLPSLAGLSTYYLQGGFTAVKGIFLKLIPRKQDLFWFPILFGIFVVFALFVHYGCVLFGVAVPEITYSVPQMITKGLWNFIEETGLLGGIFGWIGFLLPFFQRKLKNNISSGLLTGFTFGLWVLPGYGISSGSSSYLLYVMMLMSFLVFASYIFNATKGNLSFYLFAFWLAATGSHIQLYYFNMPVQTLEIVFFTLASVIIHLIFKRAKVDSSLQIFPNFIQQSIEKENYAFAQQTN